MSSKWKLWLAAAVAIAIVLFGAKLIINQRGLQTAAPVHPKTVIVQTVARVKKQPTLALTGSIEAVQEAVVSTKVAGRVASVSVENGDAVSAGQTLVQLDASDYQNALTISQANLAKAQANLDSTQDNYQRMKGLYDNGALSARDFENVKTSLSVAQADAASAATAVESAREALQNASISSPISGVAADCSVKIGQYLSPGIALLKVENISTVHAVVNVEQNDLAAIKTGLAAKVITDAYSGHVFDGTVEAINPVAGSSTRVFETKIGVANSDQLLRPGMFVKVEIETGAPVPVIVVPQNAVVSNAGLYYVFLLDGGRVKRQQVQVGQVIGQLVEITSGLAEGQKAVMTDVSTLNDGDQVNTN